MNNPFPLFNSIPITKVDYQDFHFDLLRLDLLDENASGNKLFKLKYNFLKFTEGNYDSAVTFGGAYSNHIAAFAEMGAMAGIKTAGIIRGEESLPLNKTLKRASEIGMKIFYLSRTDYRNKDISSIENTLKEVMGNYMLIPEGGSSEEGIQGAEEIMKNVPEGYDLVTCAVGTGGTLSGIIRSGYNANFLGFSALKNAFSLENEITEFVGSSNSRWNLNHDFHFGGYAKTTKELWNFIEDFKNETHIQLDQIYNAKMVYGLLELIKNNNLSSFKNILAIHTGGLQGLP